MKSTRPLRVGTRGSKLALIQAQWVASRLAGIHPSLKIVLVPIKTKGDRILSSPVSRLGGKGLFVKEIEEALLSGRVDIAVHSMKDLPGQMPEGLMIGAVPPREEPFDVLISRDGLRLHELPPQSKLATSSLRRRAQVLHLRPDIQVVDIRGNVDTRIRKLREENTAIDALILAAAGIKRMGLWKEVTEVLAPDVFIPAVGQGALAIQVRKDDPATRDIIAPLNDPISAGCVRAERAFLEALGGGCQIPVGALASVAGEVLHICGIVAGPDGSPSYRGSLSGSAADPESLGLSLAQCLLKKGGAAILKDIRQGIVDCGANK